MRLPARVVFPFGYRVRVKQATDRELRDLADDRPDGLWIAEERTIYIRKCLPITRKRYILAHELAHAVNDWMHFCLDNTNMRP